jgi:hypothetical protein
VLNKGGRGVKSPLDRLEQARPQYAVSKKLEVGAAERGAA